MQNLNKCFFKSIMIFSLTFIFLFSTQQPAISSDKNHHSLYKDIIDEYRNFADKEVEEFRNYSTNRRNKISERHLKSHMALTDSYKSAQNKVNKLYDKKLEKLKKEELNFISALTSAFNDDKEPLEKFKTGNKIFDTAVVNYIKKQKEFEKEINNNSIVDNMTIIANPEKAEINPLIGAMQELMQISEESGLHPDPMVRYGITMQAIAETKPERKTYKLLTQRYEANYALSIINEESIKKLEEIKDSAK